MAKLWGREWTRREIERRVGHPSQLGGITRLIHGDGPARGMRLFEIDTGSGLVFRVHPDRALDIPDARFRGIPLGWRSPTGDVAPAITEQRGVELLRSLPGGLLFTCGLTNVGPPSENEKGDPLPIHGHVHSLAATEVGAWCEWEGDDWVMRAVGRVTQARLFGEKLTLTRRITAILGEPRLTIEDTVRNEGFSPTPLMILHHMNLGAPLLSEEAQIAITADETVEWHVEEPTSPSDWQRFPAPQDGAGERVFFHRAAPDPQGRAEATLTNDTLAPLGLRGVRIRWATAEEPRLWQWVYPGSGGYVLGLEPTNAAAPGQQGALAAGQRVLEPGESAQMAIEVEVLTP
jgi:uncharacterized protein DUF4432